MFCHNRISFNKSSEIQRSILREKSMYQRLLKKINFVFVAATVISGYQIASSQTGSILREYWTGISGTSLDALKSNANYPANPSGKSYLTVSLETQSNWNDNYGTRIRGFVHPPVSGNYKFWIAGDDNCELWLSSDDKQSNITRIAYVQGYTASQAWYTYSSQESPLIFLEAGKRYYIEAIHKEGMQGDNLAVGWQLPDLTFERPVPASRLSPVRDDDDYSQWGASARIEMNTTADGANVSGNVLNIPVLIRLNETNFDFSSVRNDGADIRFAKPDGTHLYYQIERWAPAESKADIWVKVDTVFGNNDSQYFEMLWGKADAVSRSNSLKVFDTVYGYQGAWNCSENPSSSAPQFLDRSATANHGTARGSMNSSDLIEGIIGKGLDLDGTDDFISTTKQYSNPSSFTISMWFKTSTTAGGKLFGFGNAQVSASTNYDRHIYMDNSGRIHFGVYNGSHVLLTTTSSYNDGQWHHVTAQLFTGGMKLYMDGVLVGSNTTSTAQSYSGYWRIGYDNLTTWPNSVSSSFGGEIDQITINSGTRNQEWVKLNYQIQKESGNFTTIQLPVLKPIVSISSIVNECNEDSNPLYAFTVSAQRNMISSSPLSIIAKIQYSGTAVNGIDYEPLPSIVSIIIPADSSSGSSAFLFSCINDNIDEGNETINISLIEDTTYRRGNSSVSVTILDDDIIVPPVIISQPSDITVLEGDYDTLEVQVSGSPPFTYQWSRNGVNTGPNSASYVIPTASIAENGDHFQCTIWNAADTVVTRSALLTVTTRPLPPGITSLPPPSITRTVGDSAIIYIHATGAKPINYQWYVNGVVITGATDSIFSTGPLSLSDNGKRYTCQVSNSVSAIISSATVLTVKKPTSRTIVVTGELYDKDGFAVGFNQSVSVDVRVRLYHSLLSDSAVYSETFLEENKQAVKVVDGKFAIRLGEGQTESDLYSIIRQYPSLYVSFTVTRPGGNPEKLEPRVPLSSSPYALSGLAEILQGNVNPNSAGIIAPVGTYYVNNSNGETFIKTYNAWVKEE